MKVRNTSAGGWLIVFGVGAIAVLFLVLETTTGKATADDLKKRGEMLSAAIRQENKRLRAADELTWMKPHSIDSIVATYIPAGTSFEDAESILRAAQFDILPSPPRTPKPGGLPGEEFDIAGTMLA
jgi:hypothetical protein